MPLLLNFLLVFLFNQQFVLTLIQLVLVCLEDFMHELVAIADHVEVEAKVR